MDAIIKPAPVQTVVMQEVAKVGTFLSLKSLVNISLILQDTFVILILK